jgi:hypothetical protein
MATFETYFVADKTAHRRTKNAYSSSFTGPFCSASERSSASPADDVSSS